MKFDAETIGRKSNCFRSSWWPIKREPDVLNEEGELLHRGRPLRYVLLSRHELRMLGQTGTVTLSGVGGIDL